MKLKHKLAYMQTAKIFANLSSATLAKVGCIIVKNDRIISIGYNGTPSGWNNECEQLIDNKLVSKHEVIHAEANAICKLAKSNESGENAIAFITVAPCIECAKLLYQSGIKEIYYIFNHKNTYGIDFLKQTNIYVEQINENTMEKY